MWCLCGRVVLHTGCGVYVLHIYLEVDKVIERAGNLKELESMTGEVELTGKAFIQTAPSLAQST